jgi:hypothetical protein
MAAKSAIYTQSYKATVHELTAVIRVRAKSHSDWSKTNILEILDNGKHPHCKAYSHFDGAMPDNSCKASPHDALLQPAYVGHYTTPEVH